VQTRFSPYTILSLLLIEVIVWEVLRTVLIFEEFLKTEGVLVATLEEETCSPELDCLPLPSVVEVSLGGIGDGVPAEKSVDE
jgi:hypothetical protein